MAVHDSGSSGGDRRRIRSSWGAVLAAAALVFAASGPTASSALALVPPSPEISAPATDSPTDGSSSLLMSNGPFDTYISIDHPSVSEGDALFGNTAVFTVSISGYWPDVPSISVLYKTYGAEERTGATASEGIDYDSEEGLLYFTGLGSKQIRVTVYGDTVVEPNEIFYMRIYGSDIPPSMSPGVGTILNDDTVELPDPTWNIRAEVSCEDVVVSWSAANVAGWHVEIGYPPGYFWWAELSEPSGEVVFGEPWLYGTYGVSLYDENDDYVPGSHETFDLTQPVGCGYANVMIAGGTGVVSEQVATELGALSRSVTRLAGPDRYATAAAISRKHFPQLSGDGQPVFVATGENFPDALAGGPAAAYFGGPILLVRNHSIPPDTVMELDRIHPAWIAVLGGTGVVSQNVEDQLDAYTDGEVYRLAGPNRYATAAAISWATFDPGVDAAYVATGANFPDALAGGPAAAVRGAPILLVTKTSIPDETVDELDRLNRVGSTSWAARASSRRASPLH